MSSRQALAMIGAGTMGWQIALAFALRGTTVRLYDISEAVLEQALSRIHDALPEILASEPLPQVAAGAAERVLPAASLDEAVTDAWLVIEAIPERIELKRELFARLSEITPASVVLATNSSAFKSRLLADVTRHPERLMNAHFYGRPWSRSIVELMTCGQTDPAILEQAAGFMRASGIVPLVVNGESTGFIFNRIWHQVKKEVLGIVDEGLATPEDVDRIWRIVVGTEIGPFGWMDRAGLDVALDVERHWAAETGNPDDQPPGFFVDMVEGGRLGRKSGRGFYDYPNPSFEQPDWLFGSLTSESRRSTGSGRAGSAG